jgi:hypothetical protein
MLRAATEYAKLPRTLREPEERTMKRHPWAILLTIPLWACASKPDSSAGNAPPPTASSAPTGSSAPAEPSTTARVVGILVTPIRLAFEIPLCVGAAPLLGPGAIASAIVPFKDNTKGSGSQLLANDVKDACGPPYVATWH